MKEEGEAEEYGGENDEDNSAIGEESWGGNHGETVYGGATNACI